MSSEHEHNIVASWTDLIAKVGALAPSDEKADVVDAVEDLREKLAAVGYELGRPSWMGTGLAQSRTSSGDQ